MVGMRRGSQVIGRRRPWKESDGIDEMTKRWTVEEPLEPRPAGGRR